MKIRILKHLSSALSIKSKDSELNHTQNFITPLCMRELFYFPLTQPSRQLLLHCSTNLLPCRHPSWERALKQEMSGSKPSPAGEGWVRGYHKHVIPNSYTPLVLYLIKFSFLSSSFVGWVSDSITRH